jgi:hypothetical protein
VRGAVGACSRSSPRRGRYRAFATPSGRGQCRTETGRAEQWPPSLDATVTHRCARAGSMTTCAMDGSPPPVAQPAEDVDRFVARVDELELVVGDVQQPAGERLPQQRERDDAGDPDRFVGAQEHQVVRGLEAGPGLGLHERERLAGPGRVVLARLEIPPRRVGQRVWPAHATPGLERIALAAAGHRGRLDHGDAAICVETQHTGRIATFRWSCRAFVDPGERPREWLGARELLRTDDHAPEPVVRRHDPRRIWHRQLRLRDRRGGPGLRGRGGPGRDRRGLRRRGGRGAGRRRCGRLRPRTREQGGATGQQRSAGGHGTSGEQRATLPDSSRPWCGARALRGCRDRNDPQARRVRRARRRPSQAASSLRPTAV